MALDVKDNKKDQVKKNKESKQNIFVRFWRFLKDVKAELKRMTWPKKEDVKKATIAVFTFCVFYSLFIGGIDVIFKNLFDIIAKLI